MCMITQRSHDEGDIFDGRRFYGAGSVGTVEERCRLCNVIRVLAVTYTVLGFIMRKRVEKGGMFTWVENSRSFRNGGLNLLAYRPRICVILTGRPRICRERIVRKKRERHIEKRSNHGMQKLMEAVGDKK